VSASRNSNRSPRAAAAPALRVAAMCRWDTCSTRAPCERAISAVRSVDASSTTITSTPPGSAAVASRSASRVAPIRRSSSWAGMMTESIAGAGKVDTRVWPSTRAGQVNRAAQTAISSAATTLCQRQALDRIDSRPVCTGAQPSLRRARSLAVSPAALQGLLVELLRQVVRLPDARDQRQLGLDPVHVLFLGLEDLGEQVTADVVADRLAVGDRLAQQGQGVQLQRQVALEDLARTLADAQLAQRLEVRQSLEEQDPLGEHVGVLHLVDGFLVLVLGQFLQAPVLQHLGVQEVLVDRGQLVVERLVEEL